MHRYIHINMYVYVYMYVLVYMYMYTYTHIYTRSAACDDASLQTCLVCPSCLPLHVQVPSRGKDRTV